MSFHGISSGCSIAAIEVYNCLNTLVKLNHFLWHTGKPISLNLGDSSLRLQVEPSSLHPPYSTWSFADETGLSLPKTTTVDKRIDGYLIPGGTITIMDTQRLNKTSRIWVGDGHKFRLERWDLNTPQQARYSFLGYGMGPRKCLGKDVANVIIKLFLVAIIQHTNRWIVAENLQICFVQQSIIFSNERCHCPVVCPKRLQFGSESVLGGGCSPNVDQSVGELSGCHVDVGEQDFVQRLKELYTLFSSCFWFWILNLPLVRSCHLFLPPGKAFPRDKEC